MLKIDAVSREGTGNVPIYYSAELEDPTSGAFVKLAGQVQNVVSIHLLEENVFFSNKIIFRKPKLSY